MPYDSGYVLVGHHPQIQFEEPQATAQANLWKTAKFPDFRNFSANIRINLIQCNLSKVMEFQEAEMLGVAVPRRCFKCKSCADCVIDEDGRTIKEQLELDMLRAGLQYDEEKKQVKIKYPVVGDPNKFKDNYHQVVKMGESLWKSLSKKGMLEAYHDQIRDYIARGVWRKTSLEEVQAWKDKGNPVHYISHHGVLNDHSKSTPLRVVGNSALKNCFTGPSLNDYYGVGPNNVNNLYVVLVRWRSYEVSLVYDVSKAYHQVHTGEEEFFMRLAIWKFEEQDDWGIFGHDVMSMGDPPAMNGLEVTKEVAADKGQVIDKKAATQLKKQSYVDDVPGGGSKKDTIRMRGEVKKLPNGKFEFNGTISQILATVGFKAKVIVCSGDVDPDLVSKMTKVLGLGWDAENDRITFELVFNLSKRQGASKAGPDLNQEDIAKMSVHIFTKRTCLTLSAQIFDPLGLLSCFTINFKLLMRVIVQHGLN